MGFVFLAGNNRPFRANFPTFHGWHVRPSHSHSESLVQVSPGH